LSGYKDKSDHAQWTCTENLFWRKKTGSDSECGVLDVEVKEKKDNSDWVVAQLWNLEFEKLNSKKG
jgi:hypothetical protein